MSIAELKRGLQALGHRVVEIPGRNPSSAAGIHRLLDNIRLIPELRRLQADVVVGFDLDGFLLPNGAVRNYWVALKGIAADEARFETRRTRRGLRLRGMLESINSRHASRTLVTSRYCREVARRAYSLPEERISILPEGIDLNGWHTLSPLRAPHRDPRPTILNVAHQYPRKDTETLLEAVSLLRRDFRDVQVRIVGVGPRLEALRKRSSELDLDENVVFLGAVRDPSRLARLYLEADLFCLPSRQEGFGIVFLEAMAAGLPIVAARAAATPEVVRHGEFGLLFSPGNAGELRARLATLLSDADLRHEFSRAARQRVERYESRQVASELARAFGL